LQGDWRAELGFVLPFSLCPARVVSRRSSFPNQKPVPGADDVLSWGFIEANSAIWGLAQPCTSQPVSPPPRVPHGKQRQRPERNQESSKTETQTRTRTQARIVYAGAAEIGRGWFGLGLTRRRGRATGQRVGGLCGALVAAAMVWNADCLSCERQSAFGADQNMLK